MAPLPRLEYSDESDIVLLSPKAEKYSSPRDLPAYLSSLSLSERERLSQPPSVHTRSSLLSPFQAGSYLHTRNAPPPTPNTRPGSGTFDPHNVNNKGILALFGLICAGLVLASIWFFFWAKNGGFRFRKGDWDDYKSTVLRRKGPNGTTLSGATKTTELGGGSIVGQVERDDEVNFSRKGAQGRRNNLPRGSKNNNDNDVRAYRHEKPARVGGLNREADATYHQDFAYTDSSEISSTNYTTEKPQKSKPSSSKPAKAVKTPTKPKLSNTFYAHTPSSTDSHRPLRPNAAQPASTDSTPTRPSRRETSPRKPGNRNSVPGSYTSYTEPLDFESRYTGGSEADTDNSRGTKAYFHPIPGLGAGGGSSGQGRGGYRRGGEGRRRDSLSDSEGETGTMRS